MESQEEVTSLLEVLRSDKDPVARAKAVDALWNKADARIVEPLMHALTDEHWDVRRRAAWALGNLGKTAVEPLMRALTDDHWNVRRKAAWALGNIKDLRAIDPLIHALTDANAGVRREAARSLAVLTVINEASVKTRIQKYETQLEQQDRDAFQKCKKLYEQEFTKIAR